MIQYVFYDRRDNELRVLWVNKLYLTIDIRMPITAFERFVLLGPL